MGYINDVEQVLREKVAAAEPSSAERAEELIKFVKERLLESYRNGTQAAPKGPVRKERAYARR